LISDQVKNGESKHHPAKIRVEFWFN